MASGVRGRGSAFNPRAPCLWWWLRIAELLESRGVFEAVEAANREYPRVLAPPVWACFRGFSAYVESLASEGVITRELVREARRIVAKEVEGLARILAEAMRSHLANVPRPRQADGLVIYGIRKGVHNAWPARRVVDLCYTVFKQEKPVRLPRRIAGFLERIGPIHLIYVFNEDELYKVDIVRKRNSEFACIVQWPLEDLLTRLIIRKPSVMRYVAAELHGQEFWRTL